MGTKIEFDTDESELIQAIRAGAEKPEIVADLEPGQYTTSEVHRVPDRPLTATLQIFSLSGVVDYVNGELDSKVKDDAAEIFVHVETPTKVNVYQSVKDREDRRLCLIQATADVPRHSWGEYRSLEDMNIYLQSHFLDDGARSNVLEQLAQIVTTDALIQNDDGVSQDVVIQNGIKRATASILNPANLRPFRTFPEIDQPESPFVVRLKKSGENGVYAGLFEADGGAWRNIARRSIHAYFDKELGVGHISIIA
jgi:hypothetical protein